MSNVRLTIKGRIVDVPKMMDLPVRTVMEIITERDSGKQFSLALNALCSVVGSGFADTINDMTIDEAVALVTDWVSKSQRDREEPEIV